MSSGTGTGRKRQPGAEGFRLLLRHFDPADDRAWQLYESLRRKLICFFAGDFPFQSEDMAEEVLDRMARKLETDEIREVGEFAFGVARNLRREMARHSLTTARLAASGALTHSLHSMEHPEQTVIERLDRERKLACYRKCLARLDVQDQELLALYYPQDGANLEQRREALARKLQISSGTLRTRMARLRAQLEKCFENCCASRKLDQ